MYDPPRVLSWIVTLFAIRRPLDLLVKPGLFLLAIFAMAAATDLLLSGADRLGLGRMAALSTITAAPFLVLVFAVVTALDRAMAEMGRLATTDALTGVPNRGAFFAQATERARASETGVVLIVDADHFKKINDTYGHHTGDECLRALARRLRSVVRKTDVVGRLGGEEFAVFLPDVDVETAREIGERLVERIRGTADGHRFPVEFTVSVGVAPTSPDRGIAWHLNRADQALYRAKALGRARLEVYDPEVSRVA